MRALIPFAVLAAAPAPALAVPITIDVTGTVFAYPVYESSASAVADLVGTLADLSVYGTVTYDSSAGPAPVTTDFPSGTYKQGSVGPPLTEFVSASLTWANGTFVPAPLAVPAGATEVGDILGLANRVGLMDELVLLDGYAWQTEDLSGAASGVGFSFRDNFIDDDGPPTGSEFPNLATAIGQAIIQSVTFVRSGDDFLYTGFDVGIDITSASVRAAQVPEPGTLALLVAGLAAFGFTRWRSP